MKAFALAGLMLWLPQAAWASPICQGVSEPVIDLHVHAHAKHSAWSVRAPNPATGVPLAHTGEVGHRAATLAELKRNGVVRALVDDDGISGDPEVGRRTVAADPARLRLGIEVRIPTQDVLARIRRLHASGELVAISEVISQYYGAGPNDPRMEPLWALAEELDIPVGIHMGLGPPGMNGEWPEMRMRLGNPLLLEDVLVRHPKLRVFVIHAGWPHIDGMLAMLHSFPNLHAELGVINWALPEAEFQTYLRRLVEAGFADRLMFGSDQMVWPEAIGMAINRVNAVPFLTGKQKRDILFNNAVRFFRWDDLARCGEDKALQ